MSEIQEKIEMARECLGKYFDASLGPVLKERFILVFPDVDRASIQWVNGWPAIDYRLAFLPDGKMEWRCTLTSKNMTAPITVAESKKGASD